LTGRTSSNQAQTAQPLQSWASHRQPPQRKRERSDYPKEEQLKGGDMSIFAAAAEELDWTTYYIFDMAFSAVYRRLQKGEKDEENGLVSDDLGFMLHKDRLLHYKTREGDRICLPRAKISEALHLAHDAMGHFGKEKTYARMTETYYQPKLSVGRQSLPEVYPE
jgi:hypothetical protein